MSIQSINSNISRTNKEINDLEKKIVQESKKIHDLEKRINQVSNTINPRISESNLKSKNNDIERKKSDKVKLEIAISNLLTKKTDKNNKLMDYKEQLRKELEREEKKKKLEDEKERKKIEADDKKRQKEELTHQKKVQQENERERKRIQTQELAHERKIQQEQLRHQDKILKIIQAQSTIQNIPPLIQIKSETETIEYDIFLSHASEDKTDFVKPLALKLQELGFKVWYDEFTLKVGDSLRKKIDEGLKNSRYGTIVISESFIKKNWTAYELDSMVAKEMNGHKMILPIWHKVSKDDVINFSPNLADKVALNSSLNSIEEIADLLAEVLKND